MRELIFKNLKALDAKKRDISVEEVVRKNGIISCTRKRSIYFVRGVHRVKSQVDLNKWVKDRTHNASLNKKFFHVLRESSTKNKEDKLICKMRGSFYVISGQIVYDIVFVHAIKIQVNKAEI